MSAKHERMLEDSIVGNIIINPGNGPVDGATEADATINIQHFIADLETPETGRSRIDYSRAPAFDYGKGRFAFVLRAGSGRLCEVQMPGWPLDEVRFTEDKNPWLFPRLYVGGSSWLWSYALDSAAHDLFGEGDE